MKKFIYSMESLLQVKTKLEDQAKVSYGNARLRLTKEEEKLHQLKEKHIAYEEELRKLRMDVLDIMKIKHCEEAVEIMKQKVKVQMVAVANAAHRLELARVRLNEAMVEKKIQDKLKEKAFAEYMIEFEAEEQKEIDERNSFRFSDTVQYEEDR